MTNDTMNREENQSTTGFYAVPVELRILDQWVCWRHEIRGGKLTKIPCDANSLGKASTEDSSTWTSFEIAKECYLEHPEFDGTPLDWIPIT